MKYGDLPQSPGWNVAIYCEDGCDEGYAASRGDYFLHADDEEIVMQVMGEIGPAIMGTVR